MHARVSGKGLLSHELRAVLFLVYTTATGLLIFILFVLQCVAQRRREGAQEGYPSSAGSSNHKVTANMRLLGITGSVCFSAGWAVCVYADSIQDSERHVLLPWLAAGNIMIDAVSTSFPFVYITFVFSFMMALGEVGHGIPTWVKLSGYCVGWSNVIGLIAESVARIVMDSNQPLALFLWWMLAVMLLCNVAGWISVRIYAGVFRDMRAGGSLTNTAVHQRLRQVHVLMALGTLIYVVVLVVWADTGVKVWRAHSAVLANPYDGSISSYIFCVAQSCGMLCVLWWTWKPLSGGGQYSLLQASRQSAATTFLSNYSVSPSLSTEAFDT